MTSPASRSTSHAFILPFLLLAAAIAFRWAKLKGLITADALANFSPWMALAFTGTLVFPKRVPWLVAPLLLLFVDVSANGLKSFADMGMLPIYGCFAAAAFVAGRLRGKTGMLGGLLGVLGCSIVFYLVTNTLAWLAMPEYAKTLSGWVQALTTGLPGYPATLWFLRNSLISDLGFSLLLFAAYNSEAAFRQQQRIPLRQPVTA